MSEYSANDHLHNVTASIQQLTCQAQGVQDITGANVADYEEISPDAASSVTLSNARPGVPYVSVINNLPHLDQSGEGDPALDNPRPLQKYGKIHIYNGDESPLEIDLDGFYEGYVDIVNGVAYEKIIRWRVPVTGYTVDTAMSDVFVCTTGIPEYIMAPAIDRYIIGENFPVIVGTRTSMGVIDETFPINTIGIFAATSGTRTLYIRLLEGSTVDDVQNFLSQNEIYLYFRLINPITAPIQKNVIYVQSPYDTISAEYGTLTIKYQGIAPDEP